MSKLFEIESTKLNGLKIIKRVPRLDNRGLFERMFCEEELRSVIDDRRIVQVNHSYTSEKGAIRGMHFQNPPNAEMKIISCVRGEIFDVAVDLREGSSTYLHWHGEVISEKNSKTIVIPEGFAHGFQVLSQECDLIYFHTDFYNPKSEDGLNPLDEKLSIKWPLHTTLISHRDQSFAKLKNRTVRIKL